MAKTTDLDLREFIRDIPDFPKRGIMFRDITPLLAAPDAFRESIRRLADHYSDRGINVITAAEARGFIFAAPLALELNVGFVPVRKSGKLPGETISLQYDLEYGTDRLEIHVDGIQSGQNVLVVDDLLATGGTMDACCKLVEQTGANVAGCAFLIELKALKGAEKLDGRDVYALVEY